MKFRISVVLACFSIIYGTPLGKLGENDDDFTEMSYLNHSADPCEDFYEYTCGNFNNSQPMPEGMPLWDNFMITQRSIEKQTRDILESPRRYGEPQAVRKAKDMYSSCLNTNFLDLLGLQPLTNLLKKSGGWPLISHDWHSNANIWEKTAEIHSEFGIPMVFDLTVRSYMYNASEMVIYLDHDQYSLPTQLHGLPENDLDDYLNHNMQKTETPYITYMVKVATKLRDHLGAFRVSNEKIKEELLEATNLMANLKTIIDGGSSNNPNESITVKELQKWTDDNVGDFPLQRLDWFEYLKRVFGAAGTITENTKVYLSKPDQTFGVIKLYGSSSPRAVANLLLTRLMTFLSPETDKYMRDIAMTFNQQIGYIAPNQPRWKYCLRKVLDYPGIGMSLAVSYEYQKYYISKEKLNQAEVLVRDLRSSFNKLLDKNIWMDDLTREKAREKAENVLILIGAANSTTDRKELDDHFKNLTICRYDNFGNMHRLRAFNKNLNYASLNLPRNRNEWSQSSLVVNAFYNILNNRLIFPLAIMNAPFYLGSKEGLFDYSRIGTIIGHEITHAFDNSGRSFNGDGTYSNWWTSNTSNSYDERANCYRDQYTREIIPEIGLNVNGTITLSENIADNGGVREAYNAYREIRNLRKNQLRSDFTDDQMFFVGYGTLWCRTSTNATLNNYRNADVHAPNRFRVNVPLANMPEFSEAFNCPAESKMNPQDRCLMW